jgi:hypothetical protein
MAHLTHLVPQEYPQRPYGVEVWVRSILKRAFLDRFHDTYVGCGTDHHTLDKFLWKLVPDLPSIETDEYSVLEVEA